jgi:hypothetical protein
VNIANRIIRGFARGSCGGLPPWPPSWLGELSDHPKLSEVLRACCKLKGDTRHRQARSSCLQRSFHQRCPGYAARQRSRHARQVFMA